MSGQRYPPLVAADRTAIPGRPSTPTVTPLRDLASWLEAITPVRVVGELSVDVTGISLSTQRIQPGDLYAALPGARAHGAAFASAALAAGAVGVLTDAAGAELLPTRHPGARGRRAPARAGAAGGADLRRARARR